MHGHARVQGASQRPGVSARLLARRVLKWHKREGDELKEQDLMCDVASALKGPKATTSPEAGTAPPEQGESHLLPFAKSEGGNGSMSELQVRSVHAKAAGSSAGSPSTVRACACLPLRTIWQSRS